MHDVRDGVIEARQHHQAVEIIVLVLAAERRKLEIQREITEAEKRGDSQRVAELDGAKLELSRMLNTLK